MTKFALIQNGVVHEFFAEQPVLSPNLDVREVADHVELGWVDDGNGGLEAPAPVELDINPVEAAKYRLEAVRGLADYYTDNDEPFPQELKDYRNALRAIVRTGLVPVEGWPVEPAWPEGAV